MPAVHMKLWRKFFYHAPIGQWTVWAFCTAGPDACGQRTRLSDKSPWWRWVKSGASRNMVAAHVELLKAALFRSGMGLDEKFVLLNDQFLPVKPFSFIYKGLQSTHGPRSASDFCLRGPETWGRQVVAEKEIFLVQHSPWVVLSRNDARMLVKMWRTPLPGEKASLLLWSKRFDFYGFVQRVILENKERPLQDFAPYSLIFGVYPPAEEIRPLPLSLDLRPGNASNTSAVLETSRCRTFDLTEDFESGQMLLHRLMETMDFELQATAAGPSLQWLGPRALRVFKESQFLFAYPFHRDANLTGFSELIQT